METIGKLLSLIFIAVVGAGGATMYILDSGKTTSIDRAKSVPVEVELGNANPDLEKYREQLRQRYIEANPPAKTRVANNSKVDSYLWTDTFNKKLPDYISEKQVSDLASNNDASELRDKMNYWYNEYHRALRNNKSVTANEAYKKYKSMQYALELKNSTFTKPVSN